MRIELGFIVGFLMAMVLNIINEEVDRRVIEDQFFKSTGKHHEERWVPVEDGE